MTSTDQPPAIVRWTLRLEQAGALDRPVRALDGPIRSAFGTGTRASLLRGEWLGHAIHPLLTDLVLGTWTSASVLDLVGGRESSAAAQRLLGTGLLAAAPTAWTGWAEWSAAEPRERRVGLVHAAVNGIATTLMAASLVARRNDNRGRGKLLSLAGMSLLGAGGWLGGHLSYAQGIGVDQTVFDQGAEEWTDTDTAASDLPEGKPVCAVAGETPVFLYRTNGTIRALHNSRTGAIAARKKSIALLSAFIIVFVFKVMTGYAPGIVSLLFSAIW